MNNLVWFRNDLRVADNNSLYAASKNASRLIGVYFIEPNQFHVNAHGFKKTEKFRARFLLESLAQLKEALLKLNIPLFVFFDSAESAMPKLVEQYAIHTIYLQKEWTRDEVRTNNKVQKLLPDINFIETYDQFLFHPDDIPYPTVEAIPQVFTEFRKKCEKESNVRTCVEPLSLPPENVAGLKTEDFAIQDLGFAPFATSTYSAFPFFGGEQNALNRIKHYFFETENLSSYKKTRNGLIGESYSSKLSPWLANGCISARTVYHHIRAYESEICQSEDTYWLIFELIWRDYFKYISLKHGDKIFQINGIQDRAYPWKFNEKAFRDWVNGNTREPFVNANMIELQCTGFMSNRGRQNAASFWAKEWEQDWRIGAQYFESMLIDYDVHSNYGNWMYNAGVGNDPRDRKFNIQRQADMYDPKGHYQKLWRSAR
jgi:deoxyribodipyrimidine photo-lyase